MLTFRSSKVTVTYVRPNLIMVTLLMTSTTAKAGETPCRVWDKVIFFLIKTEVLFKITVTKMTDCAFY